MYNISEVENCMFQILRVVDHQKKLAIILGHPVLCQGNSWHDYQGQILYVSP